ncbi:MAG TPA: alpha/beta hydrolase [Candidatus Bathyarchaeia archaeon]|nr:alpha/beta hydrolase [Candidatus Bathyarchaeia archaeon]
MKARFAVFICLLLVFGIALAQEKPYKQVENIVYQETEGVGLVMDIFTPVGTPNGLGIVDTVSGAWHSDRGKIEDHRKAGMYDVFCGHGYVVFAVRPGSISKFTGEEMVTHLKQGIKWVKEHAKDYGVDPQRLGITGASAGGHLATLTVVTAEPDVQVKAAGIFFPPADFLEWGEGPPPYDRIGALFFRGGIKGKTEEEVAEAARKMSPVANIKPGLPPFLIFHGDADPLVPLQQSQALVAALTKAGNSAELIIKPGGAHPWPTIAEEVAKMADWFDKNL